jgi:hypothetical protein
MIISVSGDHCDHLVRSIKKPIYVVAGRETFTYSYRPLLYGTWVIGTVETFDCLVPGFWHNSPHWARASSFARFLDHTQRRTTVGRTTLDEWSARRRDLYPTKHNTHNRQTSMPRWDSNPQSQQASGHWDRRLNHYRYEIFLLLRERILLVVNSIQANLPL